jgi:hypothetical protein
MATVTTGQSPLPPTSRYYDPNFPTRHCPSGVAEPTTPPPQTPSGAKTSSGAQSSSSHATSITGTASGVCEPHDDHWHCPSGVPTPTTPPPKVTGSSNHSAHEEDPKATTCHAHGDHWHCPSGVPEPTTPPPSATTAAKASSVSAAPSSSAPAAGNGGLAAVPFFRGAVFAAVGVLGVFCM